MAEAAAAAAAAVVSSIAPILASYNASVDGVLAGHAALEGRLRAVLAELAAAQAAHSAPATAQLADYAGRVEALRRRLEGVAAVMGRVQGRLAGLQGAITNVELKDRAAAAAART